MSGSKRKHLKKRELKENNNILCINILLSFWIFSAKRKAFKAHLKTKHKKL
jgi:hypothetical protein